MPEVVDLTGDDHVSFEILGNPPPQPRMRRGRYGLYNPGNKQTAAFRNQVKALVPATVHGPVFAAGVSLTVVLKFYRRRPNKDFQGNNRLGMLKALIPFFRPVVPDIDNLAKFVLDGMNGLVYADDRQVVHLSVYKLLDTQGSCEGRTTVEVYPYVG